jgi:glycosyltransferase involved in cell wall biosynthesis
MLRVLTLSTLFPSAASPRFGTFVEQQTRGLAQLPNTEVEVVSGVGLPVWPLGLHRHYARRAKLPLVEERNGLKVHRPRFRVCPRIGDPLAARFLSAALLPCLRNIRERFPFDVIDAEFFWPDGVAAMRLSRALQVPFLIKARGSDIHYWTRRTGVKNQILEAGCSASKLLTISRAMKNDLVALGMPEGKISTHYTGVDLERFQPLDRRVAKTNFGVSGPLLATVGALIPLKGQTLVLEALSQLPDATLLIAGQGPDRNKLGVMVEQLGLTDRVRFLGDLPPEQVAQLLAAADVMVLPSRSEGLANVWVEALASGTPIVISDVGGAREVVEDNRIGRIVPRQPAAIAEAIRSLLRDPVDPVVLRQTASRFSWKKNATELRDHLLSASLVACAA